MKNFFCIVMFGLLLVSLRADGAGAGLVSKAVLRGTLRVAAGRSGRILTEKAAVALSRNLGRVVAKHGRGVLPLVRTGGLEILEQGAKHGDDFWRLCIKYPRASRGLALHADKLLPMARRIGPDVLKLETHSPGLAARVAGEFGDDGVKVLAHAPAGDTTRLLGYAAKADSPAVKAKLLDCYRKSADPGAFLNRLDWKNIMAVGLSAAAVTAAYNGTKDLADGLRNPAVAEVIAEKLFSPAGWSIGALIAVPALLLLAPWGVGRIRRTVAAARQKNSGGQ